MTKLSVNINKIATLRNSRGGNNPDVVKAAIDVQRFGADGVTVHPRPDERHIRYIGDRRRRCIADEAFSGGPGPGEPQRAAGPAARALSSRRKAYRFLSFWIAAIAAAAIKPKRTIRIETTTATTAKMARLRDQVARLDTGSDW